MTTDRPHELPERLEVLEEYSMYDGELRRYVGVSLPEISNPEASVEAVRVVWPHEEGNDETRIAFACRLARCYNEHDALIDMLRRQQRINMTFCGVCGGNPCRETCELAALLKKEEDAL